MIRISYRLIILIISAPPGMRNFEANVKKMQGINMHTFWRCCVFAGFYWFLSFGPIHACLCVSGMFVYDFGHEVLESTFLSRNSGAKWARNSAMRARKGAKGRKKKKRQGAPFLPVFLLKIPMLDNLAYAVYWCARCGWEVPTTSSTLFLRHVFEYKKETCRTKNDTHCSIPKGGLGK